MMDVGDRVTLVCTGNDRIPDGTSAVVESVEAWGAHVRTDATVTGRYRAGWEEMVAVVQTTHRQESPTGEVCRDCGGVNLIRSGTCLTCQDCGSTTGCG